MNEVVCAAGSDAAIDNKAMFYDKRDAMLDQ